MEVEVSDGLSIEHFKRLEEIKCFMHLCELVVIVVIDILFGHHVQ